MWLRSARGRPARAPRRTSGAGAAGGGGGGGGGSAVGGGRGQDGGRCPPSPGGAPATGENQIGRRRARGCTGAMTGPVPPAAAHARRARSVRRTAARSRVESPPEN